MEQNIKYMTVVCLLTQKPQLLVISHGGFDIVLLSRHD